MRIIQRLGNERGPMNWRAASRHRETRPYFRLSAAATLPLPKPATTKGILAADISCRDT